MKIVSVHEGVVPISSSIRNAWIDFSSMDCSIVAIVSDVVRDGEPVVGYGFNSNGRYSAGEILRRRVIPRLLDAAPEALLDEAGDLDPRRAWDLMMRNEKPGGHGERSVAVGVVDMALFDLAAKLAGQPLYRYLSDRYGDGPPDDSVFVYAAGGYYAPGKGLRELQDEMRGFLDQGYRVVKMKIGGATWRRTCAASTPSSRSSTATPPAWRSTSTAGSTWPPRWSTARPSSTTACSGTRRSATRWTTPSTPRCASTTAAPIATGENLFSLQDARNLIRYGGMRPDRDTIQVDPALSYGLTEYLRIQDMLSSTAGRPGAASRTAGTSSPCTSPRRSSSAATSPTRASSSRPAASPTTPWSATARSGSPRSPASASRARPTSTASCASCTPTDGPSRGGSAQPDPRHVQGSTVT